MTGIEPHIPVFDKSQRTDGAFSREDFTYDHASDAYRCPAGKTPALSSAVHDPADRRDERQLDTLPGQQARLRGVSPEAALLPQCTGAQDHALNLRRRAWTWLARSPRPTSTRPRAASAKRSRCCSLTSSVF